MHTSTYFAPQLFIPAGVTNLQFYQTAFGAVEQKRFKNNDGSIHVAELCINGAIFHLHEETPRLQLFSPLNTQHASAIIGLFVPDVDVVMQQALAAGATLVSPATSYDYGYRQGEIKDPFGHTWLIQMHC
jgi:PhnB protein